MSFYLIKSTLCMMVLLATFKFLLENEKMHRFNRIYLLGSLVFSLLVPFIPILLPFSSSSPTFDSITFRNGLNQFMPPANGSGQTIIHYRKFMELSSLLLIGYCIVTAGFLVRFIKNLYLIRINIKRHQHIALEEAKIVLVPDAIVTHTFYKTIFVNEADYYNGVIEPAILKHELAHVGQRHSLDILFIELLQVVYWFNPLLIWFKRSIQLNHEFLADAAVIDAGKDPKEYQHVLLNYVRISKHLPFSSPLNFNITKNRLIMLTQTANEKNILFKQWATAPLLLITLFLFGTRINAQNEKFNALQKKELTVPGEGNMGGNPVVLIDGKRYTTDILPKISPASIRSSAVFDSEGAARKYGIKSPDGVIIITTKTGKLAFITPTELENREKEINLRVKEGFYHRITLKNEDQTSYDKLIINGRSGKVSYSGAKGCKVGFLVGKKLYDEKEIGEVEHLLNTKPEPMSMGVGGNTIKKIPGLDLSLYAVIFYFDVPEES